MSIDNKKNKRVRKYFIDTENVILYFLAIIIISIVDVDNISNGVVTVLDYLTITMLLISLYLNISFLGKLKRIKNPLIKNDGMRSFRNVQITGFSMIFLTLISLLSLDFKWYNWINDFLRDITFSLFIISMLLIVITFYHHKLINKIIKKNRNKRRKKSVG